MTNPSVNAAYPLALSLKGTALLGLSACALSLGVGFILGKDTAGVSSPQTQPVVHTITFTPPPPPQKPSFLREMKVRGPLAPENTNTPLNKEADAAAHDPDQPVEGKSRS